MWEVSVKMEAPRPTNAELHPIYAATLSDAEFLSMMEYGHVDVESGIARHMRCPRCTAMGYSGSCQWCDGTEQVKGLPEPVWVRFFNDGDVEQYFREPAGHDFGDGDCLCIQPSMWGTSYFGEADADDGYEGPKEDLIAARILLLKTDPEHFFDIAEPC